MNKKLENLIQVLEKIDQKISKKYKNMELIEGQYNPKIKTIAKVLRLQTEKKITVYNTMLMDASKMEVDISEEGHEAVLNMLRKCETTLNDNSVLSCDNIIETAMEFSKLKIDLFTSVRDILNEYESEKNIKHAVLKEKVMIILTLEEKDLETLKSIHNKED